jgi:hypothetical protein
MQELWIVLLALAAPIAGVVGFAVQLRTVRSLRLQNTKLDLEIAALQEEARTRNALIVRASPGDIERVRRERDDLRAAPRSASPARKLSLGGLFLALWGLAFVVFAVYLIFDIYRLVVWLWSLL